MIDTKKVEDIIRLVASTEVLPRFKNLKDGDIREKNPGDFVTIADEESERAFTKLLQEFLPGSLVVGEEAVAKDEKVIQRMKEKGAVWIIDPIDGTYNFSTGRSKWGILIALVVDGETRFGWAFDALGDRLAFAEKGKGAFINGQRVTRDALAGVDTKTMNVAVGGAQPWHFEALNKDFAQVASQRCSLHDFMDFITNKADLLLHVGRVTPWDHAAGILLAEEAGGVVRVGAEALPYTPDRYGPGFISVAPSAAWSQKLHGDLFERVRRK